MVIRKTGEREYLLYGSTSRAEQLQLTVEDGHNILFGPAPVPVSSQRFRIDFHMDETDLGQAFVYLSDGDGRRLAVVPVDLSRELITAGEPYDTADVPPVHTGGA